MSNQLVYRQNHQNFNRNKFLIKNETSSSSERVQFSVYYEKPEYTVIDQIAQMTVFDLISNIGGNLGLFIGISFLV